MRNVETDYREILHEVLGYPLRPNRTGEKARSKFDVNLKFSIYNNFPLITGRFIDFKIIETEFLWFLNGETNTKRFKDKGIKIWDAWADNEGELGPVYGYQMRHFNGIVWLDQLQNVIDSIKNDPFGRRHIISLWNPIQLEYMRLPPCYLYFQFYVAGESLNMKVIQRSADLFIGIPHDIGLFAYLLIYVSMQTRLAPSIISLNMVDAHIYEFNTDAVVKYLNSPIYNLPTWIYNYDKDTQLITDVAPYISVTNYNHGPRIKNKVAV